MKNTLLFLLLFGLSQLGCSQDTQYHRIKDDLKEFVITPYHNEDMVLWKTQIIMSKAKSVIYSDTINAYQVKVPDWLDLWETRSLYYFGGTLPPVNKVDNAITIRSYEFGGDKSFAEFKQYIVENPAYVKGQSPEWSDGKHSIKSVEKLNPIQGFDSYKVAIMHDQKEYLMNYVLLQTKKSVIWISLISTEETYEINIAKFKEFMKTFELL